MIHLANRTVLVGQGIPKDCDGFLPKKKDRSVLACFLLSDEVRVDDQRHVTRVPRLDLNLYGHSAPLSILTVPWWSLVSKPGT